MKKHGARFLKIAGENVFQVISSRRLKPAKKMLKTSTTFCLNLARISTICMLMAKTFMWFTKSAIAHWLNHFQRSFHPLSVTAAEGGSWNYSSWLLKDPLKWSLRSRSGKETMSVNLGFNYEISRITSWMITRIPFIPRPVDECSRTAL